MLVVEAKAQEKALRHNVVYIVSDDQGWKDVGYHGSEIKTPNLDQLAAEGIRFTSFYAGSPVCAPSRYSLMTGLHTGHAFIRGNDIVESVGDLAEDAVVLAGHSHREVARAH